jgi:hypothetical protein
MHPDFLIRPLYIYASALQSRQSSSLIINMELFCSNIRGGYAARSFAFVVRQTCTPIILDQDGRTRPSEALRPWSHENIKVGYLQNQGRKCEILGKQ